jgi:hypothetical protein
MYNNPYYNMQRFPQMEPIQTHAYAAPIINTGTQRVSTLNGKQVDSIDVVKAIEYPLDGSVSYFPLTDGSAIVTKQLRTDGTSRVVVYKPVEEQKNEFSFITADDLNAYIQDLEDFKDLKEELNSLKKQLKELKESIKEE